MSKILSNIYVDRVKASKLLKVSTRTLDRYVRRYKIRVKKQGRKVLVPQKDVDRIIDDHIGHFLGDFKRFKASGHVRQNVQHGLMVKDVKIEDFKAKRSQEIIYKELFLDLKKDLKEKQDRLEAATYRVGQLESQLKNMVPLLEYNRKDKELKEAQIVLENRMIESQATVSKMRDLLRNERVAKWVYLSLTGLLLIAEPILFLIWAFS